MAWRLLLLCKLNYEDNLMADENEESTDEGNEEETSGGGSKKKLIIMIVGALLVLGGAAGGAMYFMGGDEEAEIAEGEEEVVEEEPKDIAYLPFEKPLVINYQSADGKTRFLKTDVTLMTENEAKIDEIRKHLPKIQHVMNMVLSRQKFEDLGTAEGKEKMRMEALEEIQKVLNSAMGEDNVDDIFYTTFVTQ